MGNNFTATTEWYDAHPKEAAAFLALWEEGIKGWRDNQAEIIRHLPAALRGRGGRGRRRSRATTSPSHDWFVDSVFLDDEWINNETKLYDLMKETD